MRCGSVYSMRAVSLPATEERPGLHLPAILPADGCSPHLATRADDTPAAVLRRLQVRAGGPSNTLSVRLRAPASWYIPDGIMQRRYRVLRLWSRLSTQVHKEQAAPIEAFFGAAGVLQHVDIVGGVEHMRGVLLGVMRPATARQAPQGLLQRAFA